MGREQKGWRKGVGRGKKGNACPQTPRFWKTRSPTNGAPDWCGVVILIDKCFKFAWMIPVITSCVTRICHKRKLFSCCFNYRYRTRRSNIDSLIWQPRLALLSHFSCSDNERPKLRSRRLVVVFRAKANLLALTIFKTKDSDFRLVQLFNG